MITYVTGNIFDTSAQCLINPVNCVGVMGKGLALEFKQRYPACFTAYKKLCNTGTLQIGSVGFFRNRHIPHVICFFPTKDHWQHPSKLSYIDSSLLSFLATAPDAGITSAAFPMVGCGTGGLNFEYQVRPLLEKRLETTTMNIEVYVG
jgi:O-acetyl-ADP-ribose deacetylase (regulator of RNase III)